jgi:hypothetical protein
MLTEFVNEIWMKGYNRETWIFSGSKCGNLGLYSEMINCLEFNLLFAPLSVFFYPCIKFGTLYINVEEFLNSNVLIRDETKQTKYTPFRF